MYFLLAKESERRILIGKKQRFKGRDRMKKRGLALAISIMLFGQTIYATTDMQQVALKSGIEKAQVLQESGNQILLNGQLLEISDGVLEVKGHLLYPLRWLVMQMGIAVSWDQKTRTVTIENPTYQEAHLYLSYLNGLTSENQDTTYKLPDRVKTLEIPSYPLKSNDTFMLHQKPIGITIDDDGFNISFAAYDYAFKNNRLYVTPEWFNTIFLAELTKISEGLEIVYPTPEQIEKELENMQKVLAPLTPEETLALWVRGQQVRSGALQYSSLSPELKQQVLASKRGWVTGGSSPSAGKVTILDKKQQAEATLVYTLAVEEMLQGQVFETVKEQITIKKYTLEGNNYWLISEARGDLSYLSLLPDADLK